MSGNIARLFGYPKTVMVDDKPHRIIQFRGKVGCGEEEDDKLTIFRGHPIGNQRVMLHGKTDDCQLLGWGYRSSNGRLMGRTICGKKEGEPGIPVPCCTKELPDSLTVYVKKTWLCNPRSFVPATTQVTEFTSTVKYNYQTQLGSTCYVYYYGEAHFICDPPGIILDPYTPPGAVTYIECSKFVVWAIPYVRLTLNNNKITHVRFAQVPDAAKPTGVAEDLRFLRPECDQYNVCEVRPASLPGWTFSTRVITYPPVESEVSSCYRYYTDYYVRSADRIPCWAFGDKVVNVSCLNAISFININDDANHIVSIYQ